jgi:transposase
MQGKLYHLDFRGKVARSTLADASEAHDWRIFADFAHYLIGVARRLHAEDPIGFELGHDLYALDSTTMDLCLSLFPWAKFRKHKAAVKMHTLLDLHGNIPTFISITNGNVHDVNILDEIVPEAGAFYVMDRGYVDFARLYVFTLSAAFFVVRTKSNIVLQRRYSHPVDKSTGVRSDHTVILTAIDSANAYPEQLRRVSYLDVKTRKRFKFLTNNFTLPALTIALIYKSRWQVELFFKALKQTLKIKTFVGTSANAVRTQVWTALIAMLVLKYLQLKSKYSWSLSTLAALLRQQLFFYRDLYVWLDDPFQAPPALAGVHDDAQQLEITW